MDRAWGAGAGLGEPGKGMPWYISIFAAGRSRSQGVRLSAGLPHGGLGGLPHESCDVAVADVNVWRARVYILFSAADEITAKGTDKVTAENTAEAAQGPAGRNAWRPHAGSRRKGKRRKDGGGREERGPGH